MFLPGMIPGNAGMATRVETGCGCRCIRCKSGDLESMQVGKREDDGYFEMHHTCRGCNAHFDHLEGVVFEACDVCGYAPRQ